MRLRRAVEEVVMATDAIPAATQEGLPFPLQDSEQVLAVVRRHWMLLWPKTALYLLFAFGPLIVISLVLGWVNLYDDAQTWFWLISALWLVFWAVLNWYQYHNDIWVITNQRIVDSIKKHPFNHRLASADLVNVQDISVHRRGIFQTTLNYGDIVCKTASAGADFVLAGIPRPADIQLLVDRERDRERKSV
jgi:hypothetical protein